MEAKSMENKTNLHEDLIREILLRLPLKSLGRFKCVSKSWLSLISNVHFGKLHYELTASHTQQLLFNHVSIVDSNKAKIQYVDPEGSLELVRSVKLVSPFRSSQDVSILGVCRGFILLGHGPKHRNLLVWNPSTGIHRTIGSSLPCLPYQSMRVNYIFEYDAFTDDYFVIIAWIRKYYIDTNCVDRFELFSMRTNSWKQFNAIKDIRGTKCCGDQPPFLFVNGAIHWLTKVDASVKAIVVFDLTKRNYSEIPLPHDWSWTLKLELVGGCLCLFCYSWQQGFAMLWMMEEYKVKSSWTKCNFVPPHATNIHGCYFTPIYFTKAGEIVGYYLGTGLAKLNDKGELLKITVPEDGFRKCHIYTASLLSLPTDSGQP